MPDLVEQIIEPRTLEVTEEQQQPVEGTDDEALDEVTERVNKIQANIKSLYEDDVDADPGEDSVGEDSDDEAEAD